MDLFITKNGFNNPAWIHSSPAAEIVDVDCEKVHFERADTVWLLSSIDNLDALIISAKEKGCNVVVMFTIPNNDQLSNVIALGASAYCSALADVGSLRTIKQVISQGGIWVPSEFSRSVARFVSTSALNEARKTRLAKLVKQFQLSKKELEVLALVLTGAANSDIASSLFISERTVKEHISRILKKLNVKNRVQLVLLVLS